MDALHSDGHSTQLSRTKSVSFHFPFYFFESEKKPSSLQLDSHLFFPAPTGRLDWWMKVSGDPVHKQLNVNLFWKVHKSRPLLGACHKPMHFPFFFSPGWICESGFENISLTHRFYLFIYFFLFPQWSKQFRANGRNVSYVVSMQKATGAKGRVCSTAESYCTFQLPWTAKKKVYLSAVNAAGRSNPTEAQIYLPKGKPDILTSGRSFFFPKKNIPLAQRLVSVDRRAIVDVSAQAQNDEHLLVQWRSLPYPDLKDTVVEWRPLLKTCLSFTHFEITEPNQTSLIIKGISDSLCITAQSSFQPVVWVSCPVWSVSFSARLCSHTVPVSTLRLHALFTRPFWRLQTLQDLCVSQV